MLRKVKGTENPASYLTKHPKTGNVPSQWKPVSFTPPLAIASVTFAHQILGVGVQPPSNTIAWAFGLVGYPLVRHQYGAEMVQPRAATNGGSDAPPTRRRGALGSDARDALAAETEPVTTPMVVALATGSGPSRRGSA